MSEDLVFGIVSDKIAQSSQFNIKRIFCFTLRKKKTTSIQSI